MIEKNMLSGAEDAAELADLIDSLMAGGSGHVNITARNSGGVVVETVKSTDCSAAKGACCQPTELTDDEE